MGGLGQNTRREKSKTNATVAAADAGDAMTGAVREDDAHGHKRRFKEDSLIPESPKLLAPQMIEPAHLIRY